MMMIGIRANAGSEIAACSGGAHAQAKKTEDTPATESGEVKKAAKQLEGSDSNEIAQAVAMLQETGTPTSAGRALPNSGTGTAQLAELAKALSVIIYDRMGDNGFFHVNPGQAYDAINQINGNQFQGVQQDGQGAQIERKGQAKQMQGNGFTIVGQKFVGNPGQTMGQGRHATDGMTAEEHTRRGVQWHEDMHRQTAQAYGIQTGASVVTMDGDLATSGHVELRPQLAWDANRARTDSEYLNAFKKQATGMIAAANAPSNNRGSGMSGLDSSGYGKLSQADIDISNKWKGELAKAEQVG